MIVTTDQAPLVGILGDQDLSKIANPRLFKLKEKTLRYLFRIQHRSGKWHRGSDAMSRYPAAVVKAIFDVCLDDPSEEDVVQVEDIESSVFSVTFAAIDDYGDDVGVLSPDLIRVAGRADETYHKLIEAVGDGFPSTRHQTAPTIREYWEVRDRLSTEKDLVLLDRRIVIPVSCRKRVLHCLHSAHQ